MTTPTLQLIDRAIANIESSRRAHINGPNKPPYPDYDETTRAILADYKHSRNLIRNALEKQLTEKTREDS